MDIWSIDRSVPHGEWTGCPEALPPPVNSQTAESRKCLTADELILFFQRPNLSESLYAATRDSKSDYWSKPIDLGPVLAGSKMPFMSCLSSDGSALYFCDHPWAEPREAGSGREDIWYLPITISSAGVDSALAKEGSD